MQSIKFLLNREEQEKQGNIPRGRRFQVYASVSSYARRT